MTQAAAGIGESAGIRGLVIVGRVRIGHQQRRPSDGRQLRDRRGAGAADHQLRARQPRRDVGKKAADLGVDAGLVQLRGDPLAILGPRLLADPQRAAQFRRQRGQRRRHDLGEDPRPLAAAGNQQLDRRAGLRRPILRPPATASTAGRTGLPVCTARAVSAGAQPGGRGEPGGDPRDAAAPAADWRGRARRSARGSRSERRAGSPPASSGPRDSRRSRPPRRVDRRRSSRRACTTPSAISATPRAARIGPPPMPPGPDLTDLDPRHRRWRRRRPAGRSRDAPRAPRRDEPLGQRLRREQMPAGAAGGEHETRARRSARAHTSLPPRRRRVSASIMPMPNASASIDDPP